MCLRLRERNDCRDQSSNEQPHEVVRLFEERTCEKQLKDARILKNKTSSNMVRDASSRLRDNKRFENEEMVHG